MKISNILFSLICDTPWLFLSADLIYRNDHHS
jgi:hypothetical protein